MEKQPAPDNLDGATYVWKDLTYKVWGANDMHDGSAKAAFDQAVKLLGHAPHENVVESDYYIISDFDEKNDIFYRKCVFNNALVYCEEVSYPQDYKTAVVPIVNKIASFRIADRQQARKRAVGACHNTRQWDELEQDNADYDAALEYDEDNNA